MTRERQPMRLTPKERRGITGIITGRFLTTEGVIFSVHIDGEDAMKYHAILLDWHELERTLHDLFASVELMTELPRAEEPSR